MIWLETPLRAKPKFLPSHRISMTCYDLSGRMDPTRTGIIGGFVSEAAITYRPQLDALRTFAVFGVLGSHYWLKESLLGHFGVRLFFVLSGFLITSILLQRGSTLAFYARRAARLWPAFYLCLAFALLLDLDGYRTSWKWHAAQLTNIFLSRHGTWDLAWPAAALWSLNV